MKTNQPSFLLFLTLMVSLCFSSRAQDTFSIVAIDSATGEIGSAGASCVGWTTTYPHGAQIISDVIPGVGAIHTQSYWLAANQQNANARMLAGDSPSQIIDWLIQNDFQGNPGIRQYGIVDYNNGHPRSAAFTGTACYDYKDDTAGLAYSIQGNILLGQEVIDSIQSRFLNTPGTLAVRLMAALQGAKMTGADTRCATPYQSSSLSSFIRVARHDDVAGSFYLDLWMSYPQTWTGAVPLDPIDSLQTLFDVWLAGIGAEEALPAAGPHVIVYQQGDGSIMFRLQGVKTITPAVISVYDLSGRLIWRESLLSDEIQLNKDLTLAPGIYSYQVTTRSKSGTYSGKFVIGR